MKTKPLDARIAAKVLHLVCKHFNITPEALSSPSNKSKLVRARYCCYWLLSTHGGGYNKQAKHEAVGELVNRDRTTVVHGLNEIRKCLDKKEFVYEDLQAIEKQFLNWLQHPWHRSNTVLPDFTMKALYHLKQTKYVA